MMNCTESMPASRTDGFSISYMYRECLWLLPGTPSWCYGLCSLFKDQFLEDDDVRERRQVNDSTFPEPPHLCYTDSDGATNCKVYTRYSKRLSVNISLYSDELNPKGQYCHYNIIGGGGRNFSCRIPANLPGRMDNKTCIVHCDVDQEGDGSLLEGSPCQRIRGNPTVTFWTYLVVSIYQS
jgi:hypothetical protein